MANQINLSNAGIYTETDGSDLVISNAGIYVEETNETNQIDISNAGIYVENDGTSLDISNVGIYVEESEPSFLFAVYYNNYKFCSPKSIKFQQSISIIDTTTLVDLFGRKIPNLPTWKIDVSGFWCKDLAISLGDLGNQTNTTMAIFITDKNNSTVEFSNAESFITSFVTELNIDNVIIYNITFVGSGILNYSSVI